MAQSKITNGQFLKTYYSAHIFLSNFEVKPLQFIVKQDGKDN